MCIYSNVYCHCFIQDKMALKLVGIPPEISFTQQFSHDRFHGIVLNSSHICTSVLPNHCLTSSPRQNGNPFQGPYTLIQSVIIKGQFRDGSQSNLSSYCRRKPLLNGENMQSPHRTEAGFKPTTLEVWVSPAEALQSLHVSIKYFKGYNYLEASSLL